MLHNASALAQESATCNQTDLHVFSHVSIRVKQLLHWTPLRAPQSHEHVLVASCFGASLLLSTIITFSGSGAACASGLQTERTVLK